MDYIDYELNKYYENQELADKMAELGFETTEEYYNYLEELKEDAEISRYEAMMER